MSRGFLLAFLKGNNANINKDIYTRKKYFFDG
jgi:hypothetical protein